MLKNIDTRCKLHWFTKWMRCLNTMATIIRLHLGWIADRTKQFIPRWPIEVTFPRCYYAKPKKFKAIAWRCKFALCDLAKWVFVLRPQAGRECGATSSCRNAFGSMWYERAVANALFVISNVVWAREFVIQWIYNTIYKPDPDNIAPSILCMFWSLIMNTNSYTHIW